jgi:hypothetical protein
VNFFAKTEFQSSELLQPTLFFFIVIYPLQTNKRMYSSIHLNFEFRNQIKFLGKTESVGSDFRAILCLFYEMNCRIYEFSLLFFPRSNASCL